MQPQTVPILTQDITMQASVQQQAVPTALPTPEPKKYNSTSGAEGNYLKIFNLISCNTGLVINRLKKKIYVFVMYFLIIY